ncbi:MAG: hypothetical protein H6641_16750 [Caldilineaceae bacterium]|nr:hypothetical protein [Caldilineaceae bacterium]
MLTPLTTDQQQWVDTTLNAMTLPQAAGQLLCPSNPRFTTDEWLALMQKVPLGTVNVRNYTTAETRERLQRMQDATPIPLLVMGDMENGANMLLDSTEFPRPHGGGRGG